MSQVLFSGGRGNKNLLSHLGKRTNANFDRFSQWSIIVNGLDDGASTGAIRDLFNGRVHGISDFLKVILAISCDEKLSACLEMRLPTNLGLLNRLTSIGFLNDFINHKSNCLGEIVFAGLSDDKLEVIRQSFRLFLEHFYNRSGRIVDLSDYKVGNVVFAALLVQEEENFTASISRFCEFCSVDQNRFKVLESSQKSAFLAGLLKNGVLLPNEAAVVMTRVSDFIDSTYQLDAPLTIEQIRRLCSQEFDDKIDTLKLLEKKPKLSKEVKKAIQAANLVVFGAGTPFSSILPTLELDGICSAMSSSSSEKVLVANLIKETSNTVRVIDIVENLFTALSKGYDFKKENLNEYLTHIIIPNMSDELHSSENMIEFEVESIMSRYPWIKIVKSEILNKDSMTHNGERLYSAIREISDAV